mmetsp:Transcript_31373/g.78936  ORF Transcript_31373/g.78936 Transcript_31373/m.78936 type:complete len:273 (-) Transcript_31373:186-1004(-)
MRCTIVNAVLMILGSCVVMPSSFWHFSASSAFPKSSKRCSNAPEYGMIGDPPCSCTQAWILASHLFFLRLKSSSLRLTRNMQGLAVRSWYSFRYSISLTLQMSIPLRTSLPASRKSLSLARNACSASNSFLLAGLLFILAFSLSRSAFRRATASRSLALSSFVMISMSPIGSTLSSTWMMSASSNALRTWMMPSMARMCDRNALPRPAPCAAPLTSPAMSTISSHGWTSLLGLYLSQSQSKRSSGTWTRVSLGSMVQKGKFSAGIEHLVRVL